MNGLTWGAFAAGLVDVSWMDDVTRERAKAKLDAISKKIGYPDTWETSAGLGVGDGHYATPTAHSTEGLPGCWKGLR